jgi:hypothetical protein
VKQRLLLFAILALLAATLIRCSEDPNPVGARLLPGSDLLSLDTVSLSATESYSQIGIPSGAASRLLVGSTPEVESWAVVSFSAIPDSIVFFPMVSAEINLRTVYHFGSDSLAPFSVAVHKVLMQWGADSLTIDSVNAPGFYDPTSYSSLDTSFAGDTATISIPIDTAIVRSWGTISDTSATNYGLLIRPTNTGLIKGFATFLASDQTQLPELLMRFKDAAGNIDTAIVITGSSRSVAKVKDASWASDSVRLYVRNGVAYRGIVGFDISPIPPHAAIHKATLQLTLDPSSSEFNLYTVDSTLTMFIGDDGSIVNTIVDLGEPQQVGDQRVHQSSIGEIVQRWVRASTQHKVAISGYDEPDAADLFVFYGAAAPPALKPKLTVIYSIVQ